MYTIERKLPLYEVNHCLAALAEALEPLRGDGDDDVRAIFDYRTSPQKVTSIAITSIDDLPFSTRFTNIYYDFMLDLIVPHDGAAESLRAAEYRLNRLCRRVWETLLEAESETWTDLTPARSNLKPGAPAENPYVRRALLFVRVTPV